MGVVPGFRPQQRDVWGASFVRRHYARSGVLDPGEQAAMDAVGDLAAARVLDLGVGAGRTTELLAPRAKRYVGIDISPRMLADARTRCPAADLRLGDARDLAGLPTAGFDLVVFSFNGIDALTHEDRPRALAEMRRVLADGGRLAFSTLNVDQGPAEAPIPGEIGAAAREWRHPRMASRRLFEALLGRFNHRRTAHEAHEHGDWAWRPLRAHEFRFVVHHQRFGAVIAELRAAGFAVEGAWSSAGTPLDLTAERHDCDYAHLVCRAVPESQSSED
jgi:SAM-dependent methyltransferase